MHCVGGHVLVSGWNCDGILDVPDDYFLQKLGFSQHPSAVITKLNIFIEGLSNAAEWKHMAWLTSGRRESLRLDDQSSIRILSRNLQPL